MSTYIQLQRDVVSLAKGYVTEGRVFHIMREKQIPDLQSPEFKAAVFNQLVTDLLRIVDDHLNTLQNKPLTQRSLTARQFTTLYWDVVSAKLEELEARVFPLNSN